MITSLAHISLMVGCFMLLFAFVSIFEKKKLPWIVIRFLVAIIFIQLAMILILWDSQVVRSLLLVN